MTVDHEFGHLRQIASSSWLGRGPSAAGSRLEAAWTHSMLARAASHVGAWASSQPPEALVRLSGLTLFWMGIGRLLFVWTTSPYVATGLPWWVIALWPGTALGVALCAGAVTRASHASMLVRLLLRRAPRS